MNPASRTPEGEPNLCPICGNSLRLDPSRPPGDAPCPHCGSLVWFETPSPPLSSPSLAGVQRFTLNGVYSRAEALGGVLDRLVEVKALDFQQRMRAFSGLLRREDLGSTAVGRGRALPNTLLTGLHDPIVAVAEFPGGVDFGAADGEPITRMCVFIAPQKTKGERLRQMLDYAAQLLRED